MSRRTTLYLDDYVMPRETVTITAVTGLVGWGPSSGQPGRIVDCGKDGSEVMVEILGGMTGHQRKYEPDVAIRATVPIAKLERVKVYMLPSLVPERCEERQQRIDEREAAR